MDFLQLNILHMVVEIGISLILLAMLARVILSWFRIDERYAFVRFIAKLTDPFLEPVRRIIRPVGVMDMSYIVVWFLLQTMQILLLQALPPGW